ncbi:MAG: cell division protein ZapC [Idiomarinaceae bacterium HL-53]|nr:MAG: cell division protein ZapC [Idiomarinaceae bacterium HL-53]CUS49012.1 cell division protein ZapC [Idiomarinaceae bacterium HL-53]
MQSWQWIYNEKQEQLAIEMDGGLTEKLQFRRKHLRPDMKSQSAFSLDDAELFSKIQQYLEQYCPLSSTEQLLFALHAVAFARFGRALMPQSWHFQTGVVEPWPAEYLFCSLNSGFAKGSFLMIEQDERTALCMLIDPSFEVASTKVMKRFEVIRVLKDRLLSHELHPVQSSSDHWQQFA